MASTCGKLEARISIPSGGWAFAITDDVVSSQTVTIPNETFYHSSEDSLANDLAASIAAYINAVASDTWTVTISAGEGGTGKYTISADGATCEITWTDTELRDLLGKRGS